MAKICVYETAPVSAVSYYRSIGVLSELHRIDPSISIETPQQIAWSTLCKFDIFFAGRPCRPEDLQALEIAKGCGLKIWIDYDDLLHEIPKWNPFHKHVANPQSKKIIESAITMADVVTVSTPVIKDYYKHLNSNIRVIENALNNYRFPLQHFTLSDAKDVLISWRGSATHKHDLWDMREAYSSIDKKFDNVHWLFIGNEHWFVSDFFKHQCFTVSECDVMDYHTLITESNISIMTVPLQDILFNRAKSDISYLEATLAGAPCIAPNLPEFDRPGCVQYRAGDSTHFEYLLEKLVKSRSFRQENYDKAFEYVQGNRVLSIVNQKRVDVINNLLNGQRSAKQSANIIFPDSPLAHKYCIGHGLELGPAAHNPFHLEDCLTCSPATRIDFWNESQEKMCGTHMPIDIVGDAENIPAADNNFDYIISSHVIEHVPNPIKAFVEWKRVLKNDGIVFMIFPKRDADVLDKDRPINKVDDFIDQWHNPQPLTDEKMHIWVWDLQLMVDLIEGCNHLYDLGFEIIETLETDDKCGNGHTVVCRVKK
jgi:hypothetical protein